MEAYSYEQIKKALEKTKKETKATTESLESIIGRLKYNLEVVSEKNW